MEDSQTPYMFVDTSPVVLTPEEKKILQDKINAGWKTFVLMRPDKQAKAASAQIQNAGISGRTWLEMDTKDRKVFLADKGLTPSDADIAEGWPFKGNSRRLSLFKNRLQRTHWAVLNSGLPAERIEEIRKHLHVVNEIDGRILNDFKHLSVKIDKAAKEAKEWADFNSIETACDAEFAAKQRARQFTSKAAPTVEEFKTALLGTLEPVEAPSK